MTEPLRPIRSEADHAAALAEIDALFNAAPGSPEADRLEVLAVLVADYERGRESEAAAHPIDVLTMSMKAQGRTQADLAALLGSRSRASEVLGRRRALSTAMIEKLTQAWAIPSMLLSAPYSLESKLMRATKAGAAVLAIGVTLGAVSIGGTFAAYGANLPNTAQIAATFAGAQPAGFTPLNQIPPEAIKAFLAEDARAP